MKKKKKEKAVGFEPRPPGWKTRVQNTTLRNLDANRVKILNQTKIFFSS